MKRTSVDTLVARRMGLSNLTADTLQRAQMHAVKELVQYAIGKSALYRERYANIDIESLNTFADLETLPFLTSEDVKTDGHRLLCVSQAKVERVVTMQTSGSTGLPKRYSFSSRDIRSIVDFFYHGMQTLINKDDRVLVWLPFELPDSVGHILLSALKDGGVYAEGMWPPRCDKQLNGMLIAQKISCVVGLPQHLLALSELVDFGRIRSMLLCSDYAAPALRKRIEQNTGCETFLHYGATESGLGGGVECEAHDGCHIRESELLVEIVDPETGFQRKDGELGEVVITTLGREAMPLIRYRTGDIAAIDRTTCICGGITSRLSNIRGRLVGCRIGLDDLVYSPDMDDWLYHVPGLLDYRAWLDNDEVDRLHIDYIAAPGAGRITDLLRIHITRFPSIRESLNSGELVIGTIEQVESFAPTHTLKRTLLDKRVKEVTYATCS